MQLLLPMAGVPDSACLIRDADPVFPLITPLRHHSIAHHSSHYANVRQSPRFLSTAGKNHRAFSTMQEAVDVAIAGGGLAGLVTAKAVLQALPDARVKVKA